MESRHKYDAEFWSTVTWEPYEKEELRRMFASDAALGAFSGMLGNQLEGNTSDEDILDQLRFNLKLRHIVRLAGK